MREEKMRLAKLLAAEVVQSSDVEDELTWAYSSFYSIEDINTEREERGMQVHDFSGATPEELAEIEKQMNPIKQKLAEELADQVMQGSEVEEELTHIYNAEYTVEDIVNDLKERGVEVEMPEDPVEIESSDEMSSDSVVTDQSPGINK